MEFLKLDPDIDSDPAVMRAGWWGARFYELLLRVSARKDLGGRISPDFQDLGYLARMWNLREGDAAGDLDALMADARDAAMRAGLVLVDGEDWLLRGWDKYYRPAKSNAERQLDFRQRRRNGSNAPPLRRNGSNESNDTPPTPPTTHHPPGVTPEETGLAPTDAGNPVVSAGGLRAPDSLLAGALPGRRVEDRPAPPGETLRDRMELAWREETGQQYRWRSADDHALRDVLELAHGDWGEVERVWRNAARAAFPKCLNVASLARHWNAYANEAQPKKTTAGGGAAAPIKHLG